MNNHSFNKLGKFGSVGEAALDRRKKGRTFAFAFWGLALRILS
jgi:hypothetical protein